MNKFDYFARISKKIFNDFPRTYDKIKMTSVVYDNRVVCALNIAQ